MQLLFAVLDDLFQFATQSLFGVVTLKNKQMLTDVANKPLQPLLPLPASKLLASLSEVEVSNSQDTYFVCIKEASLGTDPVRSFDDVIAKLPYGSQVVVLKYGGRWAMVQAGDVVGWVLKDELRSDVSAIIPCLKSGNAYDSQNAETKKLRLFIRDEFSCKEPTLPLMGAEYISYRLRRGYRQIAWPEIKPRLPGRWQKILRGQPGIHIGVTPKTGSVMEYIENDIGYLLFIDAVFPDESIQVSAVGYEGLGVYSESVLPKEVWRELRPVFIEFK